MADILEVLTPHREPASGLEQVHCGAGEGGRRSVWWVCGCAQSKKAELAAAAANQVLMGYRMISPEWGELHEASPQIA